MASVFDGERLSEQKEKRNRESETYHFQTVNWRKQNRPEKCIRCLRLLNYCQYWEKEYKCDSAMTAIQTETNVTRFRNSFATLSRYANAAKKHTAALKPAQIGKEPLVTAPNLSLKSLDQPMVGNPLLATTIIEMRCFGTYNEKNGDNCSVLGCSETKITSCKEAFILKSKKEFICSR